MFQKGMSQILQYIYFGWRVYIVWAVCSQGFVKVGHSPTKISILKNSTHMGYCKSRIEDDEFGNNRFLNETILKI
jgi:hypothetical protein